MLGHSPPFYFCHRHIEEIKNGGSVIVCLPNHKGSFKRERKSDLTPESVITSNSNSSNHTILDNKDKDTSSMRNIYVNTSSWIPPTLASYGGNYVSQSFSKNANQFNDYTNIYREITPETSSDKNQLSDQQSYQKPSLIEDPIQKKPNSQTGFNNIQDEAAKMMEQIKKNRKNQKENEREKRRQKEEQEKAKRAEKQKEEPKKEQTPAPSINTFFNFTAKK